MEFECKRLEQCLETLKRDKKLKSWTEHNNESGYTVITIRCISKVTPKFLDSKATRETTNSSDQNSTPVSETSLSDMNTRVNVPPSSQSHQNNTRESSTRPSAPNITSSASTPITEPNSSSRKVFKPISQYQLKRDSERREAFRVRCTTRSRSNQLSDNSDIAKALDKSVEMQRDTSQNVSLLSNACISPIIPSENPWADNNPYSCLDVDSDVKSTSSDSDSSDELYGATGEVLSEPGLTSVPPQFRSIAMMMAKTREDVKQLATETRELSELARNSVT